MNILVIGLGSIAKKHIDAIKEINQNVVIYALRSSNTSLPYPGIIDIYSLDNLRNKPDFILISNPTYLHKYAMEIAELTNLKGAEQKQLVIDIIRKIVKESQISVENESICLDFIDSGTLSQTIDLIVDATKGRLAINKPISLAKRVLLCCLPFLNRRATINNN